MAPRDRPGGAQTQTVALIGMALTATSVASLAAGWFAQRQLDPEGPAAVAVAAAAWALLATPLAVALRGQGLIASLEPEGQPASLHRHLLFFAVLESGVLGCAVALVVSPAEWPLLAAAPPLALMVVNLPRVWS